MRMKAWRKCCSSNPRKSARLRIKSAAASTRASAALLCRRLEARPGYDGERAIGALDVHGDLDLAITAAFRRRGNIPERRRKPQPQDAIIASLPARDDDGVQLANGRIEFGGAVLRVVEFLHPVLVDDE